MNAPLASLAGPPARSEAQQTAFAFVMMYPGDGIGLEYAMTANSALGKVILSN